MLHPRGGRVKGDEGRLVMTSSRTAIIWVRTESDLLGQLPPLL